MSPLLIRCPQCGLESPIPDNQIPPPQTPVQCPRCNHIYYLYQPPPAPIYTVPVKHSRTGWWIAGISLTVLLILGGSILAAGYFGYRLFSPMLKTVAAIQKAYPQAGAEVNINTRQGETTLLIKYRTELEVYPGAVEGELGEELIDIAQIAYETYQKEKPGQKIDFITVCAFSGADNNLSPPDENCLTLDTKEKPASPEKIPQKPKQAKPKKKIPAEGQTNI